MNRPSVQSFVSPEWKSRIERRECPVCGTPRVAFEPPRKKFCSDKCQEEYGKRWKVWATVRAKVLIRDKYTCQYPGCGMNIEKAEKIHEETREAHDKENIVWVTTNCADLIEAEQTRRMETASKVMEEAVDLESIVKEVYRGLRFRARDRYDGLPKVPPEDAHRVNLNLEVDHKNPVANGGELWDQENLWTLCEKHHRKKTKEDMKKIRAKQQTQPPVAS